MPIFISLINLASKIQLNYFLQTASFNEKARTLMPDEGFGGRSIDFVIVEALGALSGIDG